MKKAVGLVVGLLVLAALGVGVWILAFHADWLKAKADDDDDEREVMPDVPVTLGKVGRATLRRYVDGYGAVEPEPGRAGTPAASARVASPVAGIVSFVHAVQGQKVERGAPLVQLDDRLALAEVEKAKAGVRSARASLEKLKSVPRPDQVAVAEMQVDRARRSVDYLKKKVERTGKLLAEELASERTAQEADLELASAENDLAVARKQLTLLKTTPTAEEVGEAEGKVVEAEKALAGAEVQRSLLTVVAPLSGTVVRSRVNPGEAVDLSTVLAEVVDLDRLVVEVAVPASALRSVKAGMPAELRATGDEPKGAAAPAPQAGAVQFVGLDVDRKTDTALVRLSVPARSPFAVGQFVRARIVVEEHPHRLVVPRECVVRTAEGKTAVVGFLGDKAIQKEVRVLLQEGELAEIEGEEIDEGDAIVLRGAYGLPGEGKVRVQEKK